MIYKKKSSILGLIIIALLLICISYILLFARSNIVSSVCDRLWKYYLIMGLIMILVFLAIKNEKIFLVYIIVIFSFFSWYSFADQSYSVVDETMNFEYVNHIIRTKQLPTFSDEVDSDFLDLANNNLQETIISTNYEAVQTPLYYIILAILGCKIKSAYFRLRLFRILGLYSICFVYYFVNKTVRYLKINQLFDIDEECLRATYLLTIFSPGYLFRASRLNNEILVCVLMAVLIYIAVKCILEGYNLRYYWGMAMVSIALFMTKTTAIYAFCVLAIVALFQKKVLKAIIPVGVCSLTVVPWVVFNYKTYGRLTAMKEHLEFVLPIINPNKMELNFIDSIFGDLPISFYSGDEYISNYLSGELFWINLLYGIFIIAFLCVSITSIKKLHQKDVSCSTKLNIIFVVSILGCLACLIMGTISTSINSVHGRYFYGLSVVIILMMVLNVEKLNTRIKNYIKMTMIIALAVVMTRTLNICFDNYFMQENLFASDVKNVQIISSLSKDKTICIPYRESDKYKSYQILQGHVVYYGNQETIVNSVSDVKQGESLKYIELGIKDTVQGIEQGETLSVGKKISEIKYNDTDDMINNIEGQEIKQSVGIPQSGELWGFSINLATYCSPQYNADLEYAIYDSNQNLMLLKQKTRLEIDDNSYVQVYFDKPLEVSKDDRIYIQIKFSNLESKPLAVMTADAKLDDEMYINGELIQGKTLGLHLFTIRK